MITLRRATAGLALLSLAATANAVAQCPGLENFKTPPAGSWAEYKTTNGSMRLAVLGSEGTGVRMEMAMTTKEGPAIVQMVVPGYPYEMSGITEMVFQRPGTPAMRMPTQMLAMMRDRMPKDMLAEACRNAHSNRVGEETITVPAGTFHTVHYHDAEKNTDVWLSNQLPFPMVQVKTGEDTIVLTGSGAGAKSQITGPIQDMPMGGPRN